MTVKELIYKLGELEDENLIVKIYDSEHGYDEMITIETIKETYIAGRKENKSILKERTFIGLS